MPNNSRVDTSINSSNTNFKKFVSFRLLTITGLIFIDQVTKWFFFSQNIFIFGIHLHLIKNFGLSFGFDFGATVNSLIILVALFLFLRYSIKNLSRKRIGYGLLLVLSGAISNIFDRLYFGFVRDFIDPGLGFTFNLADIFVMIGLVLLITKSTNQDPVVE